MIIGLQHLSTFSVSSRTPTTIVSYPPFAPTLPPNPLPSLAPPVALSGGGYPGSPSSTLSPIDTTGLQTSAQTWFLMLPILTPFVSSSSPQYTLAVLDSNNYDDPIDNTTYVFRMEEIKQNCVPTVRRVILEYRDLGLCTVTCIISGTNDNGKIVTNSLKKQIGNKTPTGTILTAFFDLTLTGFRPQIAFTRKPGDGPLCIISTTIVGEHEEVSL